MALSFAACGPYSKPSVFPRANRSLMAECSGQGGCLQPPLGTRAGRRALVVASNHPTNLEENPDREVVIDSTEEYGIEFVKQLAALVCQRGAKRVCWPD